MTGPYQGNRPPLKKQLAEIEELGGTLVPDTRAAADDYIAQLRFRQGASFEEASGVTSLTVHRPARRKRHHRLPRNAQFRLFDQLAAELNWRDPAPSTRPDMKEALSRMQSAKDSQR